jgi:hypothetical protein
MFPKNMAQYFSHVVYQTSSPALCNHWYAENDIIWYTSFLLVPMCYDFLRWSNYMCTLGVQALITTGVYYLPLQHAFPLASISNRSVSLHCYRPSSKIIKIFSHNASDVKLHCTSALSSIRAWLCIRMFVVYMKVV